MYYVYITIEKEISLNKYIDIAQNLGCQKALWAKDDLMVGRNHN